jgi:uncharacterized membrane protein YhhN
MILAVVTAFIFISTCFTIRAKMVHSTSQLLIFKLLTIGLILFLFIVLGYKRPDFYFFTVLFGLLFSLAGDLFLISPEKHFLKGLLAFLTAHLFYIAAFSSSRSLTVTLWIPLSLLIYGSVIFLILRPNLNKMALPVGVYIVVILVMAWQAWERWMWLQNRAALFAAVGSALFLISDSLLAFNRFKRSFKIAEALILSTYFTAQWLIAMSVQFS